MYSNLLPKAIYPDMVNCHLSLYQATRMANLGPGGEVKSLIPRQHFPFPGNFSFLANFVIGGFKHFTHNVRSNTSLWREVSPLSWDLHIQSWDISLTCAGDTKDTDTLQKVWGKGRRELKQEFPAQTPLKQLLLPGQHPHTHPISSKTLKWFECYPTKGITDSIR